MKKENRQLKELSDEELKNVTGGLKNAKNNCLNMSGQDLLECMHTKPAPDFEIELKDDMINNFEYQGKVVATSD